MRDCKGERGERYKGDGNENQGERERVYKVRHVVMCRLRVCVAHMRLAEHL